MNKSQEIVLSYDDTVLRRADIELLEGPYWLNDSIISFYYEYLSNKIFKSVASDVLFVGPEVTHCIKAASVDEISLFLDPLEAKKKKLIFFALNDNRAYMQSGGTHWSLLVYSREERTIFHFDSMSVSNHRQAMQLSSRLAQYLCPTEECAFEEIDCLQQDNGYDCGIYLLCFTELLVEHFIKRKRDNKSLAACRSLQRSEASAKRQELLNLVNRLKSKSN